MGKLTRFFTQLLDNPLYFQRSVVILITIILSEIVIGAFSLTPSTTTDASRILGMQTVRSQKFLSQKTTSTIPLVKKATLSPTPAKSPTPTKAVITKAPTATVTPAVPTSTQTPTVAPPPPSQQIATGKLFGVNIAGGEFGEGNLPGTINTDYTYSTSVDEHNYFASHGLKLIRLPFRWERVQHQAQSDLNQSDIGSIKVSINVAQNAGQQVILDMHNYGRYFNTPLGRADKDKFADVWRRLAGEFKDTPGVYGYEIMNEPHDLPEGSDAWDELAQTAVDAIRSQDANHEVIVSGYDWQSAYRWPQSNANLNINDPAGKIVYSAHAYFDQDQSGTYTKSYDAEGAYPTVGVDRVQPFLNWLHDKGKQGMLTEYGVPGSDSRWLTVLDLFLQKLSSDGSIVGGTYWAGGPWWGSYPLSVEYNGKDSPQMSILSKYQSR